jgi:hypothetical protein
MKCEHFVRVVEEVLDSLPQEFRSRIRNEAVLVEDVPPNEPSPQSGQQNAAASGPLPRRAHDQEELAKKWLD